jgi:acetyltransferase EpsM
MEIDILIYGFGGHGRVLAELLNESLGYRIGVFDENIPNDLPDYVIYLGSYNPKLHSDLKIIVAIGKNIRRSEIAKTLKHGFFVYIHPSAYVSPSAKIGIGTVVLQNSIVQANAVLGMHCIINIGTLIDHDSHIGDFCHIAPNVYIGGGAKIPALIGLYPGQIVPRLTVFGQVNT